jgi:SAM-dependent methyltransferase
VTAALARCRACGGRTSPVLDLGDQPQAGLFPEPAAAAEVPLFRLLLTTCAACDLVQADGDGPDEFDDPEAPAPTSSATIAAHARGFVAGLVEQGLASRDARVLELASHRGYLHPFFDELGIATTVLATDATEAGRLSGLGADVLPLPGFARRGDVPSTLATPRAEGRYDLIVDHYLLSHLDRPRSALEQLAGLLRPRGTLVLETDHLLSIVEGCQFDAIRHGHRSYLGLAWLMRELAAVGLHIVDAWIEPVYGGALRLWARRDDHAQGGDAAGRIASILRQEEAARLSGEGMAGFAASVGRAQTAVLAFLDDNRVKGRSVVGYGAPARAVTFLNATHVGPDLLPVTADRASSKQGRVVPGMRVPIVAPQELEAYLPADVLILAWDLADEIRASMPWVEEGGGRWLVALPKLAVVGESGRREPIAD